MGNTNLKALYDLEIDDFTQTLRMIGISATVVILTILVICIWRLFLAKWKAERELASFVLTKPRHWLLGHMHLAKDVKLILPRISEAITSCNDIGQIWFGPFHCYLGAGTPETAKAILASSVPKDDFSYGLVKPWIGDGLLVSSGKKWGRNRKLLTPAFHFEILRPYTKLFNESTNILVEKWRKMCKNDDQVSMEMFKQISMLTLDSLLKCIFSVNTNCQTERMLHPYLKGVVKLTTLVIQRVAFLPYHIDFLYGISPSGWRWRHYCRMVHRYSRDVIEQRKRTIATGEYQKGEKDRKYVDFVDILLGAKDEDGNGLTSREIQDEVDTFMFEGHDTTASAISWMLYNMARYPEYQQKCRDEIDKLLDNKDTQEIEWDDLGKLPYLTMCLKESLRLHPPVPFINRMVDRQINLEDGRSIPPGTPVGVPIYALHHNGNIWDDAEDYIPERFQQGMTLTRSPYSFIPFSAGPRNCIGQNFAMNEMKITVALILRNFYLAQDESVEAIPIFAITLRAWEGIQLYVRPRTLDHIKNKTDS